MKRITTGSLPRFPAPRAPQSPHQPVLEALTSIGLPPRHLQQIRECRALLDQLSSVEVDLPHDTPLTPLPALVVGQYAKHIANAGMAPTAVWLLALHLTADAPDLRTCRPCQQQCADLLSGLTVEERGSEVQVLALLARHVDLMTVLQLADGSGIRLLQEALGKFALLSSRSAPSEAADRVNRQLTAIVGAAVQKFRHDAEKHNAFTSLQACFKAANHVVTQGLVWSTLLAPRMRQGPLYRQWLALTALGGDPPSDMDRFWSDCEQAQRDFLHEETELLHARLADAGFVIKLLPPHGSETDWHCQLNSREEPVADVTPGIFRLFVRYLCARVLEGEPLRGVQLAAYAACIQKYVPGDEGKEIYRKICLSALLHDPTLMADDAFKKLILPLDETVSVSIKNMADGCSQRLRSELMSQALRKRLEEAFKIFTELVGFPQRQYSVAHPTAAEVELACRTGIQWLANGPRASIAFVSDDEPTPEQFQALVTMMLQRKALQETIGLLGAKLHFKDKSLAEQRHTLRLCARLLPGLSAPPVMFVLASLHLHGLPRNDDSKAFEYITQTLPRDSNQKIAVLRERLPLFVGNLIREMPGAIADVRAMHYLFSLAQDIGRPECLDPLRAAMAQRKNEPPIARILRSIHQLDHMARVVTEVAQEAAQEAPKAVEMDIV